jgi:glutaminyl-peptide cyclotransferase
MLASSCTAQKCISDEFIEKAFASYEEGKDFDPFKGPLLPTLLTPRVPDTPGHSKVKDFIITYFLQLKGYDVELDSFEENTPLGMKRFTNIVSRFGSHAEVNEERTVLACHYDSKYFKSPKNKFQGAIDSAVPCAMLMTLARELPRIMLNLFGEMKRGIDFVFFDGEEAYIEWTEKDSLYGSRHLAALWKAQRPYLSPSSRFKSLQTSRNILENIKMLVLLDLIGAKSLPTTFHDMYTETSDDFNNLATIESRLRRKGILRLPKALARKNIMHNYFVKKEEDPLFKIQEIIRVDDDHKPFLDQGVPCLHLITIPFPETWHTMNDNAYSIDQRIPSDISKILLIHLLEIFL